MGENQPTTWDVQSNDKKESIVTNLPSDWCRISFINSSSSSGARLQNFQTSILDFFGGPYQTIIRRSGRIPGIPPPPFALQKEVPLPLLIINKGRDIISSELKLGGLKIEDPKISMTEMLEMVCSQMTYSCYLSLLGGNMDM